MSRPGRYPVPVVTENYHAQVLASAPLMESLMARMRNMAGELEAIGWQVEVVEGSWIFRSPEQPS